MSLNGVACLLRSGTGGSDSSSLGAAAQDFRGAGALLRFRGEALLVGEAGWGGILSFGSKISEGSMFSSVFLVFLFVGEDSVVFRRLWRRGLACGAGVKSSSSSSGLMAAVSSSESSSTTTFLRVAAARLEGLVGEIADIFEMFIATVKNRDEESRFSFPVRLFIYLSALPVADLDLGLYAHGSISS